MAHRAGLDSVLLADDDGVAVLLGYLVEDEEVRLNAIVALGKIRDERAVEPLKEAFKGRDIEIKMAADDALMKILGRSEWNSIKDKKVELKPLTTEMLLEGLESPYSSIRASAAYGLGFQKD